jgi:cytochrome P450
MGHVDEARGFEPTDHYRELRDRCPVHHADDHDPPFLVVSRFADVLDVLKHPEVWTNADGPGVFYQEGGALGTTDDPDHARQRHVLRPAFLPVAIERLAGRITEITAALLDAMVPAGEGDFVELLAGPLPALAIAELLGVRAEDRDEFRSCSDDAVHALSGGDLDRYGSAKSRLQTHIRRGIDDRDELMAGDDDRTLDELLGAGVLPDDVLSRLAVGLRDGVIDEREALHMGYQLLVAGHETTTSLLGLMMYRLLERPALMARLRAEPALLPRAIEEALRFDSPVHGLFRTNSETVELHGESIPTRTKLQVAFASANRDPAMFADPDELVLDRDPKELGRHVAFGWGIHHCIGAPLARLETRIAFEQILQRMDAVELAGPAVRNDSFVLHGLTSLPLRWRPIG